MNFFISSPSYYLWYLVQISFHLGLSTQISFLGFNKTGILFVLKVSRQMLYSNPGAKKQHQSNISIHILPFVFDFSFPSSPQLGQIKSAILFSSVS